MAVIVHAPVNGGDDTVGQGGTELLAEGVADGGHRVAHGKAADISEAGGRQAGAVDFQQGQVADRVRPYQQRLIALVVIERDLSAGTALDHMGIGDDQTVFAGNDAGAPVIAVLILRVGGDAHDGIGAGGIQLLQAQLLLPGLRQGQDKGLLQHRSFDAGFQCVALAALVKILQIIVPVLRHGAGGRAPRAGKGQGRAHDQKQQQHRQTDPQPGAFQAPLFLFFCFGSFQRRVPASAIPIQIAH